MSTEPSVEPANAAHWLGLVIIGRNEGERLVRCLNSAPQDATIVYVDSGSTDDSIENARKRGAHVVELDTSIPFTAARARNAGIAWLRDNAAAVSFIQFVDGDCELEPSWIPNARKTLEEDPALGAVFGRRRERYPEHSIFNRLCDIEWAVPPGEAKYFAGDVMIRARALDDVGGYRADMIAGEEPELSIRLRQANWRILCLDRDMTWHDAAMTRFAQWWQRATRAGYAFALGTHLHGGPPEYHWRRETRRIWLWGLLIPAVILAASVLLTPAALLLALIYPVQVIRLYLSRPTETAALPRCAFLVLGNFPEMIGQLRFHVDRMSGKSGQLIEYK